MQSTQLANGMTLPTLGLGMWKIEPKQVGGTVHEAIKIGYRHFDSACDYGNEEAFGAALANEFERETVRRDDIWVTSKLWNTYHHPDHVRPAIEKSLLDLRLDYLDLYLIHFPIAQAFVPFEQRYPPGWFFDPDADHPVVQSAAVPLIETWHAMEELVRSGLTRAIGVCNYGVSLLRDLKNQASIQPAMLQVEMHPYLTQNKLLRFCQESQIAVTAFSPLGAQSYFQLNMAEHNESLLQHPTIHEIAGAVSRTPAQVLLRFAVQRGTLPIPKTSRPERLKENFALWDFELGDQAMNAISDLNRNRRFNDPGDFCEAAFNTFYPIYE
ncbi:MAG: aldo/keto reductase [Planctomycetota bacterium]